MDRIGQLLNKQTLLIFLLFSLALFPVDCLAATTLFQDDFSSGIPSLWQLDDGWQTTSDGDNLVMSGATHSWARSRSSAWGNYSFKTRVKLLAADSAVHINYHLNGCSRYFVGFNVAELYLQKTHPCEVNERLATVTETHDSNQWYTVEIVGRDGNLKVYVDDVLKIEQTDNALASGSIAFEVLTDSPVYFDDVLVTSDEPLSETQWRSTGGPLGGLGYDVRIHAADKSVMYVTDNWAGVLKSTNAGQKWNQSNSGINVKGGTSGDATNIFSLTIDPNDNNIIWAGTYGTGAAFGVFKSTDGSSSWIKKTTGIGLGDDIALVFRGFTVQPGNSNIVYAQAEVPTTVQGREFNRVKGRVYKTTDGGEHWQLIWQGNDLARYLIIDPGDVNRLYLSTGIFDREADDSDCANGIAGGEGVLKSVDGGQTWSQINNGLTDLYVGSLRMHPTNQQVLFAATGNNACSGIYEDNVVSGLFKTSDGGASWTKVIAGEIMTTVNFSPSDPDTIYAGSSSAFFRSRDGGANWTELKKAQESGYGPAGVFAGFPIDVAVDPDTPSLLYANNYGGGVFRSTDGAATWEIWSKGYSGADIHAVHIPASTPSTVYTIGRSGPYRSSNYGEEWTGIAHGAASTSNEWNSIASSPIDASLVLIVDEHQGAVFRSVDRGTNFSEVLRHPDADASDPIKRQGFRGVAFAPSNPAIVYVGLSLARGTFLTAAPVGTVIYKSVDGGLTFSPIPSIVDGKNVRRLVVAANDPNTVYAATTSGVFKSTDGAASWTAFSSLGNRQIEALVIDPEQPGYLVAGEIFGGIWVSQNDGVTWAGPNNSGLSSSNPYISTIIMDPRDADILYAGDLYSGIYKSTDRGVTWASFPDYAMSGLTIRAVKDLAMNDRVLYAATQGGGVYRFALESLCEATFTSDLKLHVPVLTFGGQSYSADFQYFQDMLTLTEAPLLTDTSAFSDCTASSVAPDLTVHIPSLIFGGVSYWADFDYAQGMDFRVSGVGGN